MLVPVGSAASVSPLSNAPLMRATCQSTPTSTTCVQVRLLRPLVQAGHLAPLAAGVQLEHRQRVKPVIQGEPGERLLLRRRLPSQIQKRN